MECGACVCVCVCGAHVFAWMKSHWHPSLWYEVETIDDIDYQCCIIYISLRLSHINCQSIEIGANECDEHHWFLMNLWIHTNAFECAYVYGAFMSFRSMCVCVCVYVQNWTWAYKSEWESCVLVNNWLLMCHLLCSGIFFFHFKADKNCLLQTNRDK